MKNQLVQILTMNPWNGMWDFGRLIFKPCGGEFVHNVSAGTQGAMFLLLFQGYLLKGRDLRLLVALLPRGGFGLGLLECLSSG